jgi:SAM-dependent methyltransferase
VKSVKGKRVDDDVKKGNDTDMGRHDLDRELAYLGLQAAWTRAARIFLYRKISLMSRRRILDVGCADGYVTAEIAGRTNGVVVGIDVSQEMIARAREERPDIEFRTGSFEKLPFARGEFDAVITGFTLMWAKSPERALKEAHRVLSPGGVLLATGEPDYGGRIDEPAALALGPLWAEAIETAGGDPFFGRRLKGMIEEAGFRSVEIGVSSSLWEGETGEGFETYADSLRHFLGPVADNIEGIIEGEREAVRAGTRLVFMPIFWGMGEKG